jgi:hypothetical protein
MHGGTSPGAPRGSANGNYRSGKFTGEAKQVSTFFRQMAKDGEAFAARVMNQHGLKPPRAIRRRRHVKRALAAAKGGQK